MYRKMAAGWVLLFVVCIVFSPSLVSAQFPEQIVPCDGTTVGGGEECTVCHIGELAQNVLNAGIYIAIFFSAIMFAWAGWLHVTAVGDTSKVRHARSLFTNVLIGIIIILAGWLVVDTLMKVFLKADPGTFFKPWAPLCGSSSTTGFNPQTGETFNTPKLV